jgi:hypothetical protein
MHHMTRTGARPRASATCCFGVWGTVGSTGRWPASNLWELEGWEALAGNFAHELASPTLQDPSLAEWWAVAAELRRGGFDRVLVPEPWNPTIEELTAQEVRGSAYAHELVTLPVGGVRAFLDALSEAGVPAAFASPSQRSARNVEATPLRGRPWLS